MKVLFYETATNTGNGVGGSLVSLLNLVQTLENSKIIPIVVLKNYFDYYIDYEKTGAKVYILNKSKRLKFTKVTNVKKNNIIKNIVKKIFSILNISNCIQVFKNMIRNRIYFFRLVNIIKKENIEIIHCNSRLELSIEIMLAAKVTKTQIIFHYRGEAQNLFCINFLRKKADKFIAISNYIKNSLIETGITKDRIVLLYNWLNEISMVKQPYTSYNYRDNQIFKILSVGRITPWKGQHLLIEIAETLINNGFVNFNFYIIGEAGDQHAIEYLKNINSLIKIKGLESHFKFLGTKSFRDIYSANYHLLIHTSVRPEPFGRVIIEAMFNNIPVIATDLGGVKEIIIDGITGFLFNPNHIDDLNPIIMRLIRNEEYRAQIVRKASETFKNNFSGKNKLEKLINIYQNMKTIH